MVYIDFMNCRICKEKKDFSLREMLKFFIIVLPSMLTSFYLSRERETESSYLLVHCPNTHNSWGLAELKPRAENSIQVSRRWRQHKIIWVITSASQGLHWLEGSRSQKPEQDIEPNTLIWDMGILAKPDICLHIYYLYIYCHFGIRSYILFLRHKDLIPILSTQISWQLWFLPS